VRGTALDGGDPGPCGAAGRAGHRREWAARDRAVRTVLVLGPPEKVDPLHLPRTAPKTAGEHVDDAWWAAFPVDEDGALHRAALRLPGALDALAVAFVWTAPAGAEPAAAEIDADGRIAVWRAGKPVAFPAANLRFGVRGIASALAPGGPPSVLLQWRSTDPDPRIGLALGGAAGAIGADPAPVQPIEVKALGFGPKQAGLRLHPTFHWADLRRAGVLRLRTADGKVRDAADLGVTLVDGKGTVRIDLPAGETKAGAKFVVDGLRDPWGRTFPGQPVEIDVAPPQ
jgi:hypothetical protein